MQRLCAVHGLSERRVCRALGQPRSSQRYVPQPREDEGPLTQDILRLAGQYGRYMVSAHYHPADWRRRVGQSVTGVVYGLVCKFKRPQAHGRGRGSYRRDADL